MTQAWTTSQLVLQVPGNADSLLSVVSQPAQVLDDRILEGHRPVVRIDIYVGFDQCQFLLLSSCHLKRPDFVHLE